MGGFFWWAVLLVGGSFGGRFLLVGGFFRWAVLLVGGSFGGLFPSHDYKYFSLIAKNIHN